MKYIFAAAVFITQNAMAQSAGPWDSLTSSKKKSCVKAAPCWIKQAKSDESLRIVFQTKLEKDVTSIDTIEIKNVKKQKTMKFKPVDAGGILPGEQFQLYALDLNKDSFVDLALFAWSSARGGPLFYYFLFDPAKSEFVMTKNPLPELKIAEGSSVGSLGGGSRELVNGDGDATFVIDSSFQIKPK